MANTKLFSNAGLVNSSSAESTLYIPHNSHAKIAQWIQNEFRTLDDASWLLQSNHYRALNFSLLRSFWLTITHTWHHTRLRALTFLSNNWEKNGESGNSNKIENLPGKNCPFIDSKTWKREKSAKYILLFILVMFTSHSLLRSPCALCVCVGGTRALVLPVVSS